MAMYKLTFQKRVWIVKQYMKGISASRLALAQKVNRSAIYQLLENYAAFGWDGLKDHKTGRPEVALSRNAEIIILDLRRRFGYGACRIEQLLKSKGFGISHRQIEKLLLRNGLVEPNLRSRSRAGGYAMNCLILMIYGILTGVTTLIRRSN